ncbi:MAG: hypothetical protein ACP5I8_05225 [Phycisphaerae bacterium]
MPIAVVSDNAPYQRCQAVRDRAAALYIELLFLGTCTQQQRSVFEFLYQTIHNHLAGRPTLA